MLLKFNHHTLFLLTATTTISIIMGSDANQLSDTGSVLSKAQTFVDDFNEAYEKKHYAFEQQFWGTKMALSDGVELKFSADNLSRTKAEM